MSVLQAPVATSAQPLSTKARIAIGLVTAVVGGLLIAVALSSSAGSVRRAVEVLFGVQILAAGLLTALPWAERKQGRTLVLGVAVLGGALLYLGTAMPRAGRASYFEGVAQFAGVIVALALGGLLTALPLTAEGRDPEGAWARRAREGLLLVVGTILLAIGTGQLPRGSIMPPQWNWTSFLGLTVPGMIVLIAVRGAMKAAVERRPPRSTERAVGVMTTELLLVVGLSVMLYGSFTNLNLGANGFGVGFKGNDAGLALWVGAAAFLVVVRGCVKFAVADPSRGGAVAMQGLYVLGVVAFIYGERAVLLGKDPNLSAGGALPGAAAIIAGGVLVLIVARGLVISAASSRSCWR
jgi:hypothetical protein